MPHGHDKYKPEYCQAIIDHMSQGYSLDSFASKVNVGRNTVYDWTQRIPEFKEAADIARAKCLEHWESVGKSGLWSDKDNKFNAAVWIFWMKARFRWSEPQEHTHSGKLELAYNLKDEPESE